MRLGDVQDTSRKVESQSDSLMWNFQGKSTRPLTRNRKEAGKEIKDMAIRCLERQMRRISDLNRNHRLATINGVIFTV